MTKQIENFSHELSHCICSSQVLQYWPYSQISLLAQLLKVQEHIEYKVISTTYKLLQSSSSLYLCDLITVQPSRSTRSSTLVTLLQPSVTPVSRSQTALSGMLHLTWGTNYTSYSSCSLSVRSIIIIQLFSIVMLWSWTDCWPFS